MSEQNVDLYRRGVEAINARQVPDVLAPGFHMENIVTAVTDKTYHGARGFREWISDTFDGLDEAARYEIEEIIAEDDNFVVARVGIVGHGVRSGVPIHLRWFGVVSFNNGKATRTAGYATRREALNAVGLQSRPRAGVRR